MSRTLASGVAALLLAAAVYADGTPPAAAPMPPGSIYENLPVLMDDTGAPVELARLRGHPVVITMFYTTCTNICPATMAKLREIDRAYAARNAAVTFVLVSYDARNDKPKALARYREAHQLPQGRWVLCTGTPGAVRTLATRLGLGHYLDLMDHFAHEYRIVVLGPDGAITHTLDRKHNDVASLFEGSRP